MNLLDTNKLTFDTHLDELLNIIEYYEKSNRLKGTLNELLAWERISKEEIAFSNSFIKMTNLSKRSLLNSIYLTAVASFESYLVSCLSTTIELINLKKRKYESFNSVFINRQIDFSAKILSSIYKPLDHINIDYKKVCSNIGTFIPESPNIVFNPEFSAYIKNILDLTYFAEFFNDLAINISIADISKNTQVKKEFGTSSDHATEIAISSFLSKMIKMRNRIAHTGQSSADLIETDLTQLISYLKVLSLSINGSIAKGISAI